MKTLLIFSLWLCTAYATTLQAASFTADAVQTRGENVSLAKMYWLDGNVRFEYMEDDVPMVQIFDNKNNKIIWLDNKNNYYLERDLTAGEKPGSSGNHKKLISNKQTNKKQTDPCKQFVDAECVFLKKTKINDRAAEKWLITLNNNGQDFHIFQWIDVKYKSILRQENSDGSGLNVEIVEDQEINGRKVRQLTMVAFTVKGEQRGIQWYDSELDIVVKQQYEDAVIDELKNIKVGKVSKKLFIIPKDYTLYDAEEDPVQKMPASRDVTIETAKVMDK
jgi:hypothetical protein